MSFDTDKACELLGAVGDLTAAKDASLQKLNTYKVGGNAKILLKPKTKAALAQALKIIHDNDWPFVILGKGSNVLIADEGLDAVVICLTMLKKVTVDAQNGAVYAEAGLALADLLHAAAKGGVAGLEKLGGIPGSVGGALIMNAGAYSVEIGQRVVYIDGLNPDGSEFRLGKNDVGFGYRKSPGLMGKIVTGAAFQLDPGSYDTFLISQANAVSIQRVQKQPLHLPSCGCVFKNPEGGYAAELIEKAGLKSYTVGEAQVSEIHANFIVNLKHAQAADIYKVLRYVQKTVKEQFDVELEIEVKILGF